MKKLYKDRWDKKIAGICGGIGNYIGVDPSLIRVLFVFICVITGVLPLVVVYLVAYLIMPMGPKIYIEIPCKKLYKDLYHKKFFGVLAGIANYLNTDATLIRIIFIVSMLITGVFPLFITYIAAGFILPNKYNNHK